MIFLAPAQSTTYAKNILLRIFFIEFNRLIRIPSFTRLQAMQACQAINNINKLANLHPASAGCFGSQNQNKLAAMFHKL
ncbi:hypothetical protein L21SP5_03140 [Salinivirga cyanobacteriivorans]|uniref:Uncharacterized protein n=1 Tax=Salinivirga cyanobacteriivorans TaxID=1307839 RepID=A0A0S2I2W4_9BACT|nr:hypothetical protein L21SP5_03140 [Salinivirga cyanobacteriivorans]